MNSIEHFASPVYGVETPPGGNSLYPWTRRPSLCLPQTLLHVGRGRPESWWHRTAATARGTILSPARRPHGLSKVAASLASMMAMTVSSRLPLALIKVCSRWRSWWRSPARSPRDGLPDRCMMAFRSSAKRSARSFMLAAASRAPVRASGRNPSGSGQAPGTVLKSSASRCDVWVLRIWLSVDCKQGGGDSGGSDSPAHRPDRPCRAAPGLSVPRRAVGQVRAETVPTFPVCCCHATPGDGGPGTGRIQTACWVAAILNMAGWTVRAVRRRKGANSPRPGGGRQQPFGRPVPDTGERVIYAECVAADGRRSRMRPGPKYSGTNPRRRQEASPRLQPMRLSAARPRRPVPSIPIDRPTPVATLRGASHQRDPFVYPGRPPRCLSSDPAERRSIPDQGRHG